MRSPFFHWLCNFLLFFCVWNCAFFVGVFHFRSFCRRIEHEIAFSGWKNLGAFLWLSWLSRHWFIIKDIEWKRTAAEANRKEGRRQHTHTKNERGTIREDALVVAISSILLHTSSINRKKTRYSCISRMKNHLSLTHWCDFDSNSWCCFFFVRFETKSEFHCSRHYRFIVNTHTHAACLCVRSL